MLIKLEVVNITIFKGRLTKALVSYKLVNRREIIARREKAKEKANKIS